MQDASNTNDVGSNAQPTTRPVSAKAREIASDIFSEAEAAAYLHQKPRTIREWRARRGLPCFKPTAKVTLYRRADLDAWLDRTRVAFPPRARRTGPAVPPPRSSCKTAAPANESGVQNA